MQRGRGRIERFFSTVNEMFLCELDGYLPAWRRGSARKPTLTLAEFDAMLRTFLLDVYHRRECTETKTPPVERWEAHGFLPRMPDSLEQLDLLLIQVAKARQVRGGWHSLPEPPLHFDDACGIRWRNGDAAVRPERHGRNSGLSRGQVFVPSSLSGTGWCDSSALRDSPCPQPATARAARRALSS